MDKLCVASGKLKFQKVMVRVGGYHHITIFYYDLAIVGLGLRAYLQAMTKRNQSSHSTTKVEPSRSAIATQARMPTTLVRFTLRTAFAVLAMIAISMAAEPPEAPRIVVPGNAAMIKVTVPIRSSKIGLASPETKPIDMKLVSLALISTGSTFADSYTTLFARENWLAGKKGVCNVEVQSAYLYGTHPTVGRAYAVASVKSVVSVAAAYYLRKHHNRFWSLPLVADSVISLEGVGQNLATCN